MTATTQAKHTQESWVSREMYEDVCKQRDELAEALREMIKHIELDEEHKHCTIEECSVARARAALEKVTPC